MSRSMGIKLKIADVIVVASVCVIAVAVALFPLLMPKSNLSVKVSFAEDQSLLLPLEVNDSHEIYSNGHTLTVTVENGKACVSRSDCRDRICVNRGEISRGGEIIVCVPAGVSVEILSDGEDVDYVIG